jgi:topoisomerase-4 subunit A
MTKENLDKQSIKKYAENAYLNYSMYVILDRALPNIGDGLKPVQRRILYAMSELGLNASSKYKKSARTVGDVIGKFHPHGDSAAYEAMVLMAQDFSFRYPFVDGQGNWGSQDDPKSFAAMRYTESKLTKFSDLLIDELKQGTVDWQPNFDGSLLEPVIFPAKVPSILLNGTTGIAVGMATDIPSHNMTEVIDATIYVLENPKTSIDQILKYIKGPDFSNKAPIVASPEELNEMYSTGRGAFKMKSAWKKEGNDIIVTDLPHQTSGSKVLEQISNQMMNKKLPMIVDLRDEGDHEEPTRLVISLKSNRVNADDLMNHLYASTDLQKNYRGNFNLISLKGSPKVYSIKDLLSDWIAFRKTTVTRKLEHRLDQVDDRLHILEGLLIVYLDLDKVIKIIRQSDDPKKELTKKFKISDIQANAILEIKLRQLAKLEQIKLEEERDALKKEKKELEKVLNSKARLKTFIKNELKEIKENFGDDRNSPIIESSSAKMFSEEDTITSDPVTIVLSNAGWIRSAKGHEIDPSTLSYRGEDKLKDFSRGRNNQPCVFIDALGKAYTLPAHTLPSARGLGEPLTGRVTSSSGVEFMSVATGKGEDKFLIANTSGYGFLANFEDMISNKKTGKAFMKVPDGAEILPCEKIVQDDKYIAAVTNFGKLLIFNLNELTVLAKGKGTKIINIPKKQFVEKKERLIIVKPFSEGSKLNIQRDNGNIRAFSSKELEGFKLERAKRGRSLPQGYKRVLSITVERPESTSN